MRTRWMMGAVVVAGLLLAVYARSQESKPVSSGSHDVPMSTGSWTGGYGPPAMTGYPSTGYPPQCVGNTIRVTREQKAENESAKAENLADLFKGMDEIQTRKAKLKEQEKQFFSRMEKVLQEQQKALDAFRVKLAELRESCGYSTGVISTGYSQPADHSSGIPDSAKGKTPEKKCEMFHIGVSR